MMMMSENNGIAVPSQIHSTQDFCRIRMKTGQTIALSLIIMIMKK